MTHDFSFVLDSNSSYLDLRENLNNGTYKIRIQFSGDESDNSFASREITYIKTGSSNS